MMAIQKLRLFVGGVFIFYCNSLVAVGLGQIEVKSLLNESLKAEIILSNLGELGPDEIIPRIASKEDFDQIGLNREEYLDDLRFSIQVREGGIHLIQIVSTALIEEPFLNFIVELVWPNGSITREYNVLLESSLDQNLNERFGLIAPGDTLWSIASRERPNKRISVQKMMIALQDKNPDAFVNNNINYLKVGFLLRIPDEEEIKTASTVDVIEDVISQNKEYEASRAAGTTKVSALSDRGDERVTVLEMELAIANEDLNKLKGMNKELIAGIEDVSDQVEILTDLLEQKSEQLVAVNTRLQELQADESLNPLVPTLMRRQKSDSPLDSQLILGGLGLFLVGLFLVLLLVFRRRETDVEVEEDVSARIMGSEEREDESSMAFAAAESDGHCETDYSNESDLSQKGDTDSELSNDQERDNFYSELDEDDKEFESSEEVTEVIKEDLDVDFDDDKLKPNINGSDLDLELDEISEVVLGDDDLDFEDDSDFEEDAGSKIDLARAYIEMGDSDGARPLLEDVVSAGSEAQISEAKELLNRI